MSKLTKKIKLKKHERNKIMKQTQEEWTRYIQDEIKKNASYDNYKHTFIEYKDYLEECLLENPRDVEKVCQLAATYNELNYQWDGIYKLLNEFIKKYENELTDEEKSRIYTNLGYYYDDQRNGIKRAIRTLRKAVVFNPNNSKAYYGLGANYYGAGKYDKSEEMYKRACELENNPIYKFEYANLLMVNKKYEKAKIILEELIKKDFEFGKEDFAKIKYSYIVNRIRLKEFENIDNDYFFCSDLESLYYLSENYKKLVEIYLKIEAQEDCRVPDEELSIYFYSLKQLNKMNKLEKSFKRALKFKNEEIEDVKNGEFKKEWTKAEKKEEIKEIRRQAKRLKAEYEKILKTDYKPEVKIYPKFLYDCFLIDCPRHQKLD